MKKKRYGKRKFYTPPRPDYLMTAMKYVAAELSKSEHLLNLIDPLTGKIPYTPYKHP